MKRFDFAKMVASGNDFIVVDNRKKAFPDKNRTLIQELCRFHTGIGADGLLLLENSKNADFRMRIFNPDGSEPTMCGNGARCIGSFAHSLKLVNKKYRFETGAGILNGEIVGKEMVKIFMGQPKNIKLHISAKIAGKQNKIHSINTGVPHAVIFFNNIEKADVASIGQEVRYSDIFKPEGTNVNFVQILGGDCIAIRTYERGVEAETLACGTGSTASALVSALLHGLKQKIKVKTKSGETLIVDTKEISLTGPARVVFSGKIN